MATYQVFVERPSSAAPDALERLARAMAERYGLPLHEMEPRLRAGRFRVKANVDGPTAERFAADLERLGAVVSVVDEQGAELARNRPGPAPAPRRATEPPPRLSQASFQVGLAAATTRTDDPDLGALGGESGSFALSALDGSEDRPAAGASFSPPRSASSSSSESLPASIGPAIAREPAPPARGGAAIDEPIDMFAPPDAEAPVDLAVSVVENVHKKRSTMASNPPPVVARAPSGSTGAPPHELITFADEAPAAPPRSPLRAFAAHERARFATGAFLAVVLGFVPAHLLASVRERSAYAEIDRHLADKQARVQSTEEWTALDKVREADLDQKLAEKHSIALLSIVLWAGITAGFAFVWFRKIDWDRLAAG